MNFNDLEWHDSKIRGIKVDRSDPGVIDTIELDIEWYNGERFPVLFEKVDWADIKLHYNFWGSDHIADASVIEDIPSEVVQYLARGRGSRSDLYHIRSSISEISILARSFKVISQ